MYKRIIDDLSSNEDENEQTAEDSDSFIKENRHLFDPEFKEILPQIFDASWGDQIMTGTVDMTFYRNVFQKLKRLQTEENYQSKKRGENCDQEPYRYGFKSREWFTFLFTRQAGYRC